MLTPADARRRWFGAFFVIVAGGLLIWGQTILKPYLSGVVFLIYYLVCFLLALLAIVTALVDIWIMRARTRGDQQELFRRTFLEKPPSDAEPEPAKTRRGAGMKRNESGDAGGRT